MNTSKTPLGRPAAAGRAEPAGEASPVADGSLSHLGVIVDNAQDARTLAWLRVSVGDDAIRGAVSALAGSRKPYLSNLAKLLGVDLPSELEVADRDTARAHIQHIQNLLRGVR